MKVLQFTIPIQQDQAIISRIDRLPHFYPYLHRHKETQITWVQQGDGTLVVNNYMHNFDHNEVFFIGANQPHIFKSSPTYFQPKSNKSITSLDIFFDPEMISNTLLNITELKSLRIFLQKNQNGFKVPSDRTASITNKMLLIKESDDPVLRTLYFMELLKELSQTDNSDRLSKDVSLISNDKEGIRISQIYNYILQNYEKDLTLEEVAKQAYMTPHAFCRFFKKHTRHTFVSFLNEIRVSEACKQFFDGGYENISGTAYACGFNSITNFNRVFKSITGLSPRNYIESLKNKTAIQNVGHDIIS
ncbi:MULTISPECIES: AraC family transcriptional regulator [Chitinophagaceae]